MALKGILENSSMELQPACLGVDGDLRIPSGGETLHVSVFEISRRTVIADYDALRKILAEFESGR